MVHLSLEQLIAQVEAAAPGEDALRRLSLAALGSEELSRTADDLVGHFVERARDEGSSWAEIGSAMGVTKQAAQQRHVHRPPEVDDLHGLDDAARAALEEATRTAMSQWHHYVGTEHVLVGVLRGDATIAQALGCSADDALETALAMVGRGEVEVLRRPLLTARCRKTLDLAALEATERGRDSVGTLDLVLGIIREGRGIAARVLDQRAGGLGGVRALLGGLDGPDGLDGA